MATERHSAAAHFTLRCAALTLGLAWPLGLTACGGKTTVEGTPTGTDVHQCPSAAPVPGDGCQLPDFTSCTFDEGCLQTFECQPVYPEAGAPSRWQIVVDECGEYCTLGPICPSGYSTIQACPSSVECIEDTDPCVGYFRCIPCAPGDPSSSSACGPEGSSCSLPWEGDPYCFTTFECGADGLWTSASDICQ
jgi:hypothetical protein